MYADPDALDRDAAALGRLADRLREAARAHVARADTTHWESVAAEACRSAIRDDGARAVRQAHEIDEAARLLREHASTVRERLAEIARIEAAVDAWFDRARSAAAQGAADAQAALGRAAHAFVRPPSGHPDWLTFSQWYAENGK